MKMGTVGKQPGERESFSLYYGDTLLAGDNVKTASLKSIFPANTTLIIDQITVIEATARVRFWAEFGEDQTNYKLTFIVTSEDGRRFEDEVILKVKEL